MNRILIAASCALTLGLACDGSGDKAPAAGAAATAATAATAAPAATTAPAATGGPAPTDAAKANPPPAPTGPTSSGAFRMPGEPGYDCGRLLTRAEIQNVCSTEVKQVIIDSSEGRRDQTKCSRRWRSQSERRTISMTVGRYDKELTKPEAATDISGVGDLAYAWTEERAPQIIWHTARVRKEAWVIDVRAIVTDDGTPLCDLEQLGKLGAQALDRLQQSG